MPRCTIVPEKIESPSSCIEYLGILIVTVKGEVTLPEDKLARLLAELVTWGQKKACTKRELLSLTGRLHHAASVVIPGRPFLRSLIELSKIPRQVEHIVRLNLGMHTNLSGGSPFPAPGLGQTLYPLANQKQH